MSFRCGCGLATYLGLGVSPLSLELSLVVVDLYWPEPCCELNSSFVRIGWRYLCFGVNASLLVDFRRSVSNSPGVGVVFTQLPAV